MFSSCSSFLCFVLFSFFFIFLIFFCFYFLFLFILPAEYCGDIQLIPIVHPVANPSYLVAWDEPTTCNADGATKTG